MRVRLTALKGDERTRTFEVTEAEYETTSHRLVLVGRDGGKICVECAGSWRVKMTNSFVAPMTTDELVRAHDGSSLIAMVN